MPAPALLDEGSGVARERKDGVLLRGRNVDGAPGPLRKERNDGSVPALPCWEKKRGEEIARGRRKRGEETAILKKVA